MQDINKSIFQMALFEVPNLLHSFGNEHAIFYKGFKVSMNKGVYKWEDTRHNDYYEPVDPMITQNILNRGFCKVLIEVMNHSDKDKIVKIDRELIEVNNSISHWVKMSSKAYNDYTRKIKELTNTDTNEIEQKKNSLRKSYERSKRLYHKKRGVLLEKKSQLLTDRKFFEGRIKLYNN